MRCEICRQAEATFHLLEYPPGDHPPVRVAYCPACYERRYGNPPAGLVEWPRLRLRLKDVMGIVGLFAVTNVLVVLFMRSDQVQGTPAQIRDWTLKALVAANSILVIILAFSILAWWAGQIRAYQIAHGLAPKMPRWRPPSPEELLRRLMTRVIPMLAWLIASPYLIGWLTRTRRLSFDQALALWSAANLALVIVLIFLRVCPIR